MYMFNYSSFFNQNFKIEVSFKNFGVLCCELLGEKNIMI